jgi:hypothetical protein
MINLDRRIEKFHIQLSPEAMIVSVIMSGDYVTLLRRLLLANSENSVHFENHNISLVAKQLSASSRRT